MCAAESLWRPYVSHGAMRKDDDEYWSHHFENHFLLKKSNILPASENQLHSPAIHLSKPLKNKMFKIMWEIPNDDYYLQTTTREAVL